MKSLRSRASLPRVTPHARPLPLKRSDSLACRTLVSVARQRKGLDAPRCQLVFAHLDTALVIQSALHRTLAQHRLGELQFSLLVALFALDPEPITPADLASYTAVSRAAVTDALLRLESLQLIHRTRDEADRRVYHVHLTNQGRATLDATLEPYLGAVGQIARYIEPPAQPELLTAFQRLQRGAAELNS